MKELIKKHWRGVLARLPLPMLAIPASYGVFEFTHLFVPWWVAVMQAAAFETVYVGLAAYDKLTQADKWRALGISGFAVFASVAYNTLAGMFTLDPTLLQSWKSSWEGVAVLAALHGVPLALLAFFVSNFTLHRSNESEPPQVVEVVGELPIPQAPKEGGFERKGKARKPVVTIYKKPPQSLPAPSRALPSSDTGKLQEAGLTDKQIEVLELKRRGMTHDQIASSLGVRRQAIDDRVRKAENTASKVVKQYLASKVDA